MAKQSWRPKPSSVGRKVSRAGPVSVLLPAELPQSRGRTDQEPAQLPAKPVCLGSHRRCDGFVPAGLRMHLALTCCPQPLP